jgi:multidrug resistance efflux pump
VTGSRLYTGPTWRGVGFPAIHEMSFARFSLSVAGVIALVASALAGATIWLVLTQPVTVANAVAEGEVSPLVKALAGVLYNALQGIIKYL